MRLLSADPILHRGSGGALIYSRTSWSSHYSHGNSIQAESLDGLLNTFIPSEHLDSTALTKFMDTSAMVDAFNSGYMSKDSRTR